MATETKSKWFYLAVCVSVLVIAVGGLTGCKKKADTPGDPNATAGNTEQASMDPLGAAASLFREPPRICRTSSRRRTPGCPSCGNGGANLLPTLR